MCGRCVNVLETNHSSHASRTRATETGEGRPCNSHVVARNAIQRTIVYNSFCPPLSRWLRARVRDRVFSKNPNTPNTPEGVQPHKHRALWHEAVPPEGSGPSIGFVEAGFEGVNHLLNCQTPVVGATRSECVSESVGCPAIRVNPRKTGNS
eukprot:GHVU01195393.1.p1 GENE.GHVU01195393.1~~GHVU01195393.1.p1  ORF type:complete len:151 (-),score=5.13 GHVU01195393.1:195-647(-)